MFFSVFMTVKQTKKKIKIHLLLSCPLIGILRDTEKVFKWEVTWLRIQTSRRQTIGYFTSVAKDLYSGLPRTNPASDHAGLEPRASGIHVQ